MANNRMHLVCNVCLPQGVEYDFETWRKVSFHLAKWYPGDVGEWYTNHSGNGQWIDKLDEFFLDHAHSDTYPGGVENPVRLDYEYIGTPFKLNEGEV